MTASGRSAFGYYLASVDGYSNNVPCVTRAYTSAFFPIIDAANCQASSAAAVYGSCMCSKNGQSILNQASWLCVSIQGCVNNEVKTVSSLYSAFCSSATALARQIAPASTDSGVITSSGLGVPSTTGSSGLTPSTNTPTSSLDGSGGFSPMSLGLSTGAIIGIAVGLSALIGVLVGTWLCCNKREKRKEREQEENFRREQAESFRIEQDDRRRREQEDAHMQQVRDHGVSQERMERWVRDQPQRHLPSQSAAGTFSTHSDAPAPSSLYEDGSVHPGYTRDLRRT